MKEYNFLSKNLNLNFHFCYQTIASVHWFSENVCKVFFLFFTLRSLWSILSIVIPPLAHNNKLLLIGQKVSWLKILGYLLYTQIYQGYIFYIHKYIRNISFIYSNISGYIFYILKYIRDISFIYTNISRISFIYL